MKRIAWLVSLVVCLSLIVAGVAVANVFLGHEVAHWEWVRGPSLTTTGWVGFDADDPNSLARAFATGEDSGICNKPVWNIPVDIHASVAQWIDWRIDGTDWHWYVLKPGKYAADCIAYNIKSNQDVTVSFSNFNHLYYEQADKTTDDDDWIEVYYAEGDYAVPPVYPSPDWIAAPDLNGYTHTFVNSRKLHYDGEGSKLWLYIDVSPSNSACEYSNYGMITLTLDCQKEWVDADGGWIDL